MSDGPSFINGQIQETLQHFWEAVPLLWNQVRAHIRQEAAENYGISVEQFHILRHIHKGIDSTGELAKAKVISRPAISQAVDALVQTGLVVRQQDRDDRRFVRLALTQEGRALLDGIFENTHRWLVEKLAVLSTDELTVMNQGLLVMRRIIDETTS